MKLNTLLQSLKSDGHLDDPGLSKIWAYISAEHGPANYPWFIKAAIAFGAWVAATSFLSFFGAVGLLVAKGSLVVVGLIAITGATVVRRILNFEFTNQLALATSLAGHVMVFIWVAEVADKTIFSIAIAGAVLCAILYPLY